MASSSLKKSTENTVFVRFIPPSPSITRFHLQDLFSQVGPIRKCSIIRQNNTGLGYGFVKYLSKKDAETAASTHNGTKVTIDDKQYKLTVELASTSATKVDKGGEQPEDTATTSTTDDTTTAASLLLAKQKRRNRVIVRNVSFYANERHIRTVLEREFGPIVELTLPRVSDKLHRGFCFVTFEKERDAVKATQARSTPLLIKKRPVAIDYSVSKQHYHEQQRRKQQQQQHDDEDDGGSTSESEQQDDDAGASKQEESSDDESSSDEETKGDSGSENGSDDDDGSESGKDEDDDDGSSESSSLQEEHKRQHEPSPVQHDEAVEAHRSLFVRNLPFDVTRHDLFSVFSKFGYIESIFLVKDKDTGAPKGTAFVAFQKPESAERALEAAGSQGESSTTGLFLNTRRLFVNVAVDKKTAQSFSSQHQKTGNKDRRNLYLKLEGRVVDDAWESLPETDQQKRQRAFAEKNTKLRSPLFFINAKRLSIRNLAKHVNEAMLKKLVVDATKRGLQQKLVAEQDQVAHWRASGEYTTREIMEMVEYEKQNGSVIPELDEANVKKYISSVFIDRDFSSNKKQVGASRGFGFVDFEHHVHALACLRELNNNPYYAAEFVAGGKKAVEQKRMKRKRRDGEEMLIPRLIVDFAVENKAKARKQAEHRAQQQANNEKQRLENRAKNKEVKKLKRSRGAIQREKKRKQRQQGGEAASQGEQQQQVAEKSRREEVQWEPERIEKVKGVKPPKKKRKLDKEEQDFDKLVDSYRAAFSSSVEPSRQESKTGKKRWFD